MIVTPSWPFVRSVIRTTLLEAFRNRLLWLALLIVAMTWGIAQFLNQVSITESAAIQASLVAAVLRMAAVFIVVAFVITSVVRESNDKVLELILAQPEPRSTHFLGQLAGFSVVAIVLAVLFSLPLALIVPVPRVAAWGVSLVFELLLMVSVSLFCVLSLTQFMSAFAASIGFYLLSRSMDAMKIIASSPIGEHGFMDDVVAWIVNAIALLLPGIDRMSQTSWLVNATPSGSALASILLQALLYIALIAFAAMFDLYRKNY